MSLNQALSHESLSCYTHTRVSLRISKKNIYAW